MSIFAAKAGAPGIDENLQRLITSQVQTIIQQALNTMIAPVISIYSASIQLSTLLSQNWKWTVAASLLFGLCYLMHYEHMDLMAGFDNIWRCVAHTAFYNFFIPLMQVWRILYGFWTPIINIIIVTWYQITRGILQMFLKCQVQSVFIPVEHFVMGFVKLTMSFIDWLGFTNLPISSHNNIAVNDWNIEPGISELQQSLNATQVGLRCICEAMDPVWDITYAPVTSDHLPKAIDHWFNTIVRIVQMFLRIVVPPGEMPNIERITFHSYGGWLESAFFLDHIAYTTIIQLVKIFSGGLFDEANIKLPKEFIFGAAARFGLMLMQLPTSFLKGIIKMWMPNVAGDSAAMMDAFNINEVFSNWYISVYNAANSIHWTLYLIENMVGGLATKSTVKGEDLPETFRCDWAKDYDPENYKYWPNSPHTISYTAACTYHETQKVIIGTTLWVYELMRELFFKSIVLQEQNAWRVLQKFDGMWSHRESINTCQGRKFRASPLNGTARLDWSINPDNCVCDMSLGSWAAPDPNNYPPPAGYRYKSQPVYNPWCSQPTIQDTILAPMDAAIVYITHGVFGPSGIGEIFQYYSIPKMEGILEGDPEKEIEDIEFETIKFPPTNRVVIEGVRITIRLILSLPDLFAGGNWVYYDINCGYGLNHTHLQFRYAMMNGIDVIDGEFYKGVYDSWKNESSCDADGNNCDYLYDIVPKPFNMPTDDKTLRWQPCDLRKFRYPGIPYKAKDDMSMCTATNEDASCMCNPMLALDVDSPCGCIAEIPEVSTVVDDNPITKAYYYKQVQLASFRWCNYNYMEWAFSMQRKIIDSVAYLVSFGPWNNECTPARSVGPETSFDAYYIVAQTRTTDMNSATELDALKEACGSSGAKFMGALGNAIAGTAQVVAAQTDLDRSSRNMDMAEQNRDFDSLSYEERQAILDETGGTGPPAAMSKANEELNEEGLERLQEAGGTLSEMIGDKCDFAGGLAAIASQRGTCKMWSNDNLFCALGMVITGLGDLTINLQRQIHNNILQILGGNFNKLNLDLRYRICDIEKSYGALTGAASTFLTAGFGSRPFKKAIGKLLIMMFEIPLTSAKWANLVMQFLLGYIDEFKKAITGQISMSQLGSGLGLNIKGFIKDMIRQVLDVIILFLDALGDFFEAITGSGDFFRAIASMFNVLADMLVGTIFDILGAMFNLIFEFLALFSGTGDIGSLLSAMWKFIMDILGLMIMNIGRTIRALFSLMGPHISAFLNALMTGTCNAINSVICVLSLGSSCSVMSCLDGGLGNPEGQPLGSAYGGYRSHYNQQHLPRLFAQHYHTVDGMPAPMWVAENIDWNGTSVCDLFMEGVKFYNYTEMRPLERATWLNCLEERALGLEIEKAFDVSELKVHDIFYNWHRKWMISYDVVQTVTIASGVYLRYGSITEDKLRMQLIEANVVPDAPIKMFNKATQVADWVYENFKLDEVVDEFMKAFDPEYIEHGDTTMTGRMYKIGKNVGEIGSKIQSEWKERDITKKGMNVLNGFNKIRNSEDDSWIKNSFKSDDKLQGMNNMIHTFVVKMGHHVHVSKQPGKHRQTSRFGNPYKLRTPKNINITYPDEQNSVLCPNASSPACVNCLVLDNLFELVRDWAVAMGRFQSNVYTAKWQSPDPVTGFIQRGTIPDIGDYFEMMFTNNSGFVDTTLKLERSKRGRLHRTFNPYRDRTVLKKHKLKSQAAYDSSIAPIKIRWQRVLKDWEEFFIYFGAPEQSEKMTRGLKMLLSETQDPYVPFFGLGLPYAVSYIFTESCLVKTAVWNEGTSQSERLSAMDDAFFYCIIFTLALFTQNKWSVIPLGWIVSITVMINLNMLLFYWIVYGYLPACFPTQPHMLMEDILEWIQQRIAPGCFCEDYPILAGSWCASSTCYQCAIPAGKYLNCNDFIPLSKAWGPFYWFPMLLRWQAPWSIGWLAETGVTESCMPNCTALNDFVYEAFQYPNGTTGIQKECLSAQRGDVYVNVFVGLVLAYILGQMALVLFKFMVDFALLMVQTFTLFQWTATAIEQTTRVDGDENAETEEEFSG